MISSLIPKKGLSKGYTLLDWDNVSEAFVQGKTDTVVMTSYFFWLLLLEA